MKNKWLIILLIVSFIKGFIWMVVTPIFQIPDEPSHLAYVQFLAEENRRPHPRREAPTSLELFQVSDIVGFNWQIEHPVWRGYQPEWRDQIQALDPASRRNYQSNSYLTSLKRPGLYYSVASLVYRIFYQQSFLWRFFGLRFFSLLCQLMIIWLVYQTAQKLFKDRWFNLAVAAAISFHPGFSFILNGVSYEALGVLVGTLFIYLMTYGFSARWLILTALIGILIKPDLIFLIFLLPFCLPRKIKSYTTIVLILMIAVLGFSGRLIHQTIMGEHPWLDKWLYVIPIKDYNLYVNNLWQVIINDRLFSQTAEYLKVFFGLHYHQIFAWYWGVFGWLEKTLPPLTYTLLKILSIVSLVGLLKTWRRVWWLILIVLVQAAVVVANDWLSFMVSGQIYGIQGRYFLPAISAQMILFTYGLSRFIPTKLLIVGAILLNLVGLFSLFQYFGNVWF